MNNTEKVLK